MRVFVCQVFSFVRLSVCLIVILPLQLSDFRSSVKRFFPELVIFSSLTGMPVRCSEMPVDERI